MGHDTTVRPNLKKSIGASNRALVADAPIVERSNSSNAQISVRSIGAPLQMWSTNVFLAKITLVVHMGHETLVLLNQ